MSRYPFIECLNDYLRAEDGHSCHETLATTDRRVRQLEGIFKDLYEAGRISTFDPRRMTPEDIDTFVGYRKKTGVKSSTISKDLTYLTKLFAFCDNNAVERFQAKYPSHVPQRYTRRLESMEEGLVQKIVRKALNVDLDNWTMQEAYGLVVLSICAGLRPKELRLADAENIRFDENGATIWLEHVKGEQTYGQSRRVPIHQDGLEAVQRYLEARERKLRSCGKTEKALFPPIYNRGGYLAYNTIRELKVLVEKDVGQPFDYRKCRRTFGQRAVDEGQDFTNVSIVMGHSSPQTTYRSYCGQRPDRAVLEMQKLWKDRERARRND